MKKSLLFFGALFFTLISLKAQVVDSMINVYAEQVPDEKIHVHFDKDLYRAGETIWFKAYLFSGFSLSIASKNFYAELVNEKGNIIQRKIYPIAESASAGNFDIPDSLAAGNLLFRAYTTWMLNFDTAFLFQKTIPLLNKTGIAEKKTAAVKTTLIQFLPEGGNLVSGLQSVVAFKANDEQGMPVFVKGNIVDSKGKQVASFSAAHDGMGSFNLVPEPNESYQAVWTDAAGKQQTTPLPNIKTQGYVLKLTSSGDKKIFVLNRSEAVPEDWKKINIVALLGQQRVYKAKAILSETRVTSGSIPVSELPSGILTVTVFSDNWEPICERIIMVNNDNFRLSARVNTPELSTNFRGKNTFEVQVDDTLLTNMSIAITDAAVGRQSFSDNIYSRILLTGDIKDYVHNPSYYFSNSADSTTAHLDLVLLTHGWRKYNWSLVAKGRKPAIKFPFDNYLAVEAKAFGVTTASPLRSDEEIVAFVQSKDSSRHVLQMRKVGIDRFVAPNAIFYDTAILHYQFSKDKKAEKELSIAFNNNLYKGVKSVNPNNRPVSLVADTAMIARTKLLTDKLIQLGSKFDRGNVLETVVVKTKQKTRLQELEEKYSSALFRTDNGYSFDPSTEPALASVDILTYLKGRVAGLQISGNGPTTSITWRGSNTSLFLNEVPADADMLSTVSPADIAYIKVIRPPFIGATGGGAGGAIAVYTKKGSDARPAPTGLGLAKSMVVGYSTPKEFYSPNYKDLTASGEVSADFRSTLFWSPSIITDATKQKVRFEFYNNDITKAFRVVLEGVNEIGKMVRIEKVVQNTK